MSIKKVLFVVEKTPFGHDRPSSGNNSRYSRCCEMDITKQYAGVYGKVRNTLFGLFNQGIFEYFPGKVLGHSLHFFERLIDWYCTDWNGRVTDNPFAGFVNIFASG
ncbi:hypothetical protein D3C71_909280 [compost metagenome]